MKQQREIRTLAENEISATELEQALHGEFWRWLRARVYAMRESYVRDCCRLGAAQPERDTCAGAIEALTVLIGDANRSSLPEVELAELEKERDKEAKGR